MNKKLKLIFSGVFFALFIILAVLVSFVDVAPIGPVNTKIGLSSINGMLARLFGTDMLWYTVTDFLGYLAIAIMFVFAVIGAIQLIRRKSLFKVDKDIIALGGVFVFTVLIYVFFEIVTVNCRPILLEGDTLPKASFPSSHTMLILTVLGTSAIYLKNAIKNINITFIVQCVCACVMIIATVGRMLSGVHWFTDILAGVLISLALICLYSGIVEIIKTEKNSK